MSKKDAKKTGSVDLSYLSEKKLEKGQNELVERSSKWQGPSHKERREETRESKKVVQRQLIKQIEKVSWRKRVGGFCAILFLCGVGLYNFLAAVFGFMMGTGVTNLEVADTATLKRVLFDGDPWLVYCVNNQTQSQRLPRVLEDSARSLHSGLGLRAAVLPCWEATASGRSVAERFGLPKRPPLSFVVANGNKPRVVNLVGVAKSEDLEKVIKPMLEVSTYRIDSLKKWSALCTSRRACVTVGHRQSAQRDTALSMLKPLLESYRAVKVVTLDTSFWQLKLEEALLATRPGAAGKDAAPQKGPDVVCLARADSGDGNSTYGGVFLQTFDASSAAAFMKACSQHTGLVPLAAAPRINARPTKPKKVTPSPVPSPRPTPTSASKPKERRANVDHVGSRTAMEQEDEALFEAVDAEVLEQEGLEGAEDDEEEGDEVEL